MFSYGIEAPLLGTGRWGRKLTIIATAGEVKKKQHLPAVTGWSPLARWRAGAGLLPQLLDLRLVPALPQEGREILDGQDLPDRLPLVRCLQVVRLDDLVAHV